MLTPDEFVKAGDYLIMHYPLWSWARISKKRIVNYLPPNKQMLEMKNVTCNNNNENICRKFRL